MVLWSKVPDKRLKGQGDCSYPHWPGQAGGGMAGRTVCRPGREYPLCVRRVGESIAWRWGSESGELDAHRMGRSASPLSSKFIGFAFVFYLACIKSFLCFFLLFFLFFEIYLYITKR